VTHDIPILRELALLAGVSLLVNLLLRRLRVPTVVGFLLTGVLIGPGGFGLVRDPKTVQVLAEIGVVLLLFAVGLEFSIHDLRKLGRRVPVAGALQILGTSLVVWLALVAFGTDPARALFFGLLLAPSSTALVFRLITDRGELQAPHGKLLTGILLMQDLAVVPMVLLVPALAAWAGGEAMVRPGTELLMRGLGTVLLVVTGFLAARRAVPWLVARAAGGRSRETFLAAVLLVVLGSAVLSQQAGLSLALGAFFAGLFLAESEHRSQITADILPFRDTFLSIFFVSMGMLLHPHAILEHPLAVAGATIGLTVWKFVAAALAGRFAGYPWRTALAAGLGLAHIGEFSFVLAQAGAPAGLLRSPWDQWFLAGAVFSMMLTPWLVSHAPSWALRAELAWRARKPGPTLPSPEEQQAAASPLLRDHVVIAGFGLNGRNVARVLRAVHIAHQVLDVEPLAVGDCVAEGTPALIGNVTQPEILKMVGVPRARVLVLALSDPFATRHATRLARQMNRGLFILVRTRSIDEIDDLYRDGASLVIPEEFETSIEIFVSVLREYHIPNNIVEAQVMLLRQERYSLLRGLRLPRAVLDELNAVLTQGTTEAVVLLQHSPAVGQALWETGLLDPADDCKLVALVRGGKAIIDFDPQVELRVGDTVVITGTHAGIDRVMERLQPPT
jgi:CPA2 family monovalent cation:H+ antiporter-2